MNYTDRKRVIDAVRQCDMAGNPQMDKLIRTIDELLAKQRYELMQEINAEAVEEKHDT